MPGWPFDGVCGDAEGAGLAMNPNYRELALLAVAEIVLVLTALVVLGADLAARERRPPPARRARAAFLGRPGVAGWRRAGLVGLAPEGVAPEGRCSWGMLDQRCDALGEGGRAAGP
jgi:hypothetical protein